MIKKTVSILLIIFIILPFVLPIFSFAEEGSIRYQVHLQDMGWVSTVRDGTVAGTTGQARRMEAISIAISGLKGKISYEVHSETFGWLGRTPEGVIAGTTGMGKRMEAIRIFLESDEYSINYRVHVQDYGWMSWVSSGEVAGTTGQSKRIEAIQIKLIKNNKVVQEETIGGNTIKQGIDVSKYQGDIDWKKVKNAGIDFAMIRCGYRGYTEGNIKEDEKFANNVKNAYANGIKVGIYFYSSAINNEEAIEEANFVLSLLNKYNIQSYITYPITIDVEDFEGTRNFVLSKQERTDMVKAFCNTIKNAGYTPMVYSYTYFLQEKLFMNQLNNYYTWIADYYGNTWYTGEFKIWQYTDKGTIDGITGNVDLNYGYF